MRIQDKWTTKFMPFRDTELEPGTRVVATRWPATIVGTHTRHGWVIYKVVYDDIPNHVDYSVFANNICGFIYDYPRPLPPTSYEIMEGR